MGPGADPVEKLDGVPPGNDQKFLAAMVSRQLLIVTVGFTGVPAHTESGAFNITSGFRRTVIVSNGENTSGHTFFRASCTW
jgi:hypothetical protein